MVGVNIDNVSNELLQLTRYAQRHFPFHSQTPRHVNMTTLSHDENIFHIRSFHASRRREPNSIDVLCAYYFLGCLILLCH